MHMVGVITSGTLSVAGVVLAILSTVHNPTIRQRTDSIRQLRRRSSRVDWNGLPMVSVIENLDYVPICGRDASSISVGIDSLVWIIT